MNLPKPKRGRGSRGPQSSGCKIPRGAAAKSAMRGADRLAPRYDQEASNIRGVRGLNKKPWIVKDA